MFTRVVLFDEYPMVLDRTLASSVGLNQAIVLQQIHYWLVTNKREGRNFFDGRYWTYNTLEEWWEKEFSAFWSLSTLKRIFSQLEREGFLITGNYNKSRFDRTKWYSIDYEHLFAFVQKSQQEKEKGRENTHNATTEHTILTPSNEPKLRVHGPNMASSGEPKEGDRMSPPDTPEDIGSPTMEKGSLADTIPKIYAEIFTKRNPDNNKRAVVLGPNDCNDCSEGIQLPTGIKPRLENTLGRKLNLAEESLLERVWAKFPDRELFGRADDELFAQMQTRTIANPIRYLEGIITNWMKEGVKQTDALKYLRGLDSRFAVSEDPFAHAKKKPK